MTNDTTQSLLYHCWEDRIFNITMNKSRHTNDFVIIVRSRLSGRYQSWLSYAFRMRTLRRYPIGMVGEKYMFQLHSTIPPQPSRENLTSISSLYNYHII